MSVLLVFWKFLGVGAGLPARLMGRPIIVLDDEEIDIEENEP